MLGFSGALPRLWGRCPQKGARDRVWVRAGLQSWPGCRGATWGLLRPRPLHLQGAEIWGPAASSCPGLVFCGRRREGTAPSAGFEREAGRGRAPCFGGLLRERGCSSRLPRAAPHTHGSWGGCRAVSCCSSTFSCRVRDRHPAALSTGGAFLPWKLRSVERKQKRGGEGGFGDPVPSSRSRGPQELGAERVGKRGHRRLNRSQTTQKPRRILDCSSWERVLPSISSPCIYLEK